MLSILPVVLYWIINNPSTKVLKIFGYLCYTEHFEVCFQIIEFDLINTVFWCLLLIKKLNDLVFLEPNSYNTLLLQRLRVKFFISFYISIQFCNNIL